MSRSELNRCETAAEWESCSDESAGTLEESSAPASTRTLNISFVDLPAHEPSNVLRPLLAAESIDSRSKSQSSSVTSLQSLSQSSIQPSTSCEPDPQSGKSCSFATRDASRSVFLLPAPTYSSASVRYPANFAGMDTVNVPELVERLGSEEDAVRKMAVFKLQSNIGDPSFAEVFIQDGGLQKLKHLTMYATGNTLAYSLTSFSRLLEVDKGWDYVEQDLIERVRRYHAAGMHLMTDKVVGRGAGGDTSIGQHSPRSYVSTCPDRLTPLQSQSIIRERPLWFQRPEACNCNLSTIPGNACQPTVLSGPCVMRQCLAANQRPNERCYHK